MLINLCVRKGNISLHFTFTWNLSLPLLLMRFSSFSWFFPTTLGSDITRLLVTFSSRFPPTTANPTEFQRVTLTHGSASSPFPYTCAHCKYSDQMSSALPLSKCQWNMQTNPGTPSLPRLPILALVFLQDFSKYPHNRGTDKTKRCKSARDVQDIPLFTSSCVMGCWMLMEWISTYQHRSYVESVSLLGPNSRYKLV